MNTVVRERSQLWKRNCHSVLILVLLYVGASEARSIGFCPSRDFNSSIRICRFFIEIFFRSVCPLMKMMWMDLNLITYNNRYPQRKAKSYY